MKQTTNSTPNRRNTSLWILQILLAAAFLMAGVSKLAGTPAMVQLFTAVGWGQWFRYVTGAIEVAAAVLLLIPGLSGLAALLLIPTMAGAILTHLTVLHSNPSTPVILLLLAAILLWGRREQISRIAGQRSGRGSIEGES